MPVWTLTHEAYSAIRRSVAPGHTFKDTATRRPDGMLDIPVDEEVDARLRSAMFPGEELSDTIVRLIAFKESGGRPN